MWAEIKTIVAKILGLYRRLDAEEAALRKLQEVTENLADEVLEVHKRIARLEAQVQSLHDLVLLDQRRQEAEHRQQAAEHKALLLEVENMILKRQLPPPER